MNQEALSLWLSVTAALKKVLRKQNTLKLSSY